jgi:hypothetical protein
MRPISLRLPALLLLAAGCTAGAPGGAPPGSFEVRALAARGDGTLAPVEGAACVAEAPGFRQVFTAPGRVDVPPLGAPPPSIRVACTAQGREGVQVAIPEGVAGTMVYPSIGIGVGSGGDVGVGLSTWLSPAPWGGQVRYGDLAIVLR